MGKLKDLTGEKFGRLTVVNITDKRAKNGTVIWECKCDCGNIVKVQSDSLINAGTQSCGCLQKEKLKVIHRNQKGMKKENLIVDLTGKRFGSLVVINLLNERIKGKTIWKCKCDCGNERNVRSTDLQYGHVRSCGCLMIESSKVNIRKAIKSDMFYGTKVGRLKSKIPSNNTSGYKGVYWDDKNKMWFSVIIIQGKRIFLGRYKNKEDAIKARKEAEEKYFKPIIEEFNEIKTVKEL